MDGRGRLLRQTIGKANRPRDLSKVSFSWRYEGERSCWELLLNHGHSPAQSCSCALWKCAGTSIPRTRRSQGSISRLGALPWCPAHLVGLGVGAHRGALSFLGAPSISYRWPPSSLLWEVVEKHRPKKSVLACSFGSGISLPKEKEPGESLALWVRCCFPITICKEWKQFPL